MRKVTIVAHLSSVHPPFDNRIWHKECKSLAAAGFDVRLVVPHDHDIVQDGISICAIAKPKGRLWRMTVTSFQVFRRALREKAEICHFHDPELIPWGLLLRLMGKRVIYDVHEDYVTALAIVPYLPQPIGRLVGGAYRLIEGITSRFFEIVLAERYYARRLPKGLLILNYPRLDQFKELLALKRQPSPKIRLLYTGVLSLDRGAFNLVALLNALPEAELHLVGFCSEHLATEMEAALERPEQLHFQGRGTYVPFSTILAAYAEPWTAALALFEDNAHGREKELTKFFEYMAAGLPIIAADFPVWKELLEGRGLCCDPHDVQSVAQSVRKLAGDPNLGEELGNAGRLAVRTHYHWEGEAKKLESLYRRLEANGQIKAQAMQA